jgi:hypothetical protein
VVQEKGLMLSIFAGDEQYQELQQLMKKGVVSISEGDRVSGKPGELMLVNVDIVTAFDQTTGHRSRYVLSSAEEPEAEQSITLQEGTDVASEIRLRLMDSGRAEDFHAAILRSMEEPGAPHRLGSIEIDEEDQRSRTHLPVAS